MSTPFDLSDPGNEKLEIIIKPNSLEYHVDAMIKDPEKLVYILEDLIQFIKSQIVQDNTSDLPDVLS